MLGFRPSLLSLGMSHYISVTVWVDPKLMLCWFKTNCVVMWQEKCQFEQLQLWQLDQILNFSSSLLQLTWFYFNYLLNSPWPPWISKNHKWKRTKRITDVSRTVKCSIFLHWRLHKKIHKDVRYCCNCQKNTLEISAQKEGGNYCPHLTSVCWILEA